MRLLLVSLFLLFISFHAQAEKSIKADSPLLCPTIVDDSSEGIALRFKTLQNQKLTLKVENLSSQSTENCLLKLPSSFYY